MTVGFFMLGFLSLLSVSSFSLSLVLTAASSSSEGSRRIRTRRVLSGDQTKSSTSWGVSVTRWASPPDRLSSHTWVLPSLRAERKARYLPLGLQRGCEEETPSAVIWMAAAPAVGAGPTAPSGR